MTSCRSMSFTIPSDTLIAYVGAASLLVVVPGPAQALVLARSMRQGASAAVLTAIGLDLATLVHSLAAALGLSAILATSATAFAIVKLAGAAYLIFLGARLLWTSGTPGDSGTRESTRADARQRAAGTRLVGEGLMTGLLNPKVAIFFLAFLPQFVDPARGHTATQFVLLGAILALLDLVWLSALGIAAARARHRLRGDPRLAKWRDRVAGGVLVGLGIRLALSRR